MIVPRSHVFTLLVTLAIPAASAAQTVQYKSPAGVTYRSLADTGPVARAERALAAEPRSIARFVQLGIAQAGARQMQEAVRTFTRAMVVAPNDPVVYRWRGHLSLIHI